MKKDIKIGEKIYETFCENFSSIRVSNPPTHRLQLFSLLSKRGAHALLYRELMKEFIKNIDDIEVFVEKGKLYKKVMYREDL